MTALPHLDAGRIYRLTPFEEVVAELRRTFADPSAVAPQRGAVGNGRPPVTSTAGNQSYVLLGDDGNAVATLDGAALAARRTPAVSVLATDVLARHDVRRLAVFGTGVQAREHVRAMRWVRPCLEQIDIVGAEPVATERFVAMLRGEGHPAAVASALDASGADLICTCTSSSPEPVLIAELLSPGAHLNTVGSCLGDLPGARVVDDLVALARGDVRRETADEITIFVAVEVTVEDLVVATLAARNAGLIG